MEGVNMTGEYQGSWVRFKDIEKIVNKHFKEIKKYAGNNRNKKRSDHNGA